MIFPAKSIKKLGILGAHSLSFFMLENEPTYISKIKSHIKAVEPHSRDSSSYQAGDSLPVMALAPMWLNGAPSNPGFRPRLFVVLGLGCA
jgi:hypothetical protein